MAQAVVQSACTKLRSAIGDDATKRLHFTGDMQDMLEQLEDIHAVMPNAEKFCWLVKDRDRGEDRPTGVDWPAKVKEAAYMICHMVDEMQGTRTPAARNKMAANVIETKSKEMLDKITKIKEKLKELQKESVEFDAQNMRALRQAQEGAVGREKDMDKILPQAQEGAVGREKDLDKILPQAQEGAVGREKDLDKILAQLSACPTSEGPIIGREKDMGKILAQLSACPTSEGPIILLIHGAVGVGKATVAAMVFKHGRFKRYSRVWINDSNMFDCDEIGKYIISEISAGEEETTGHGSSPNDGTDHIKNQLHSVLSGKKVLLVLHDLWEKDSQWKRLKDMLSGTTQVIVIATVSTCRKDTVDLETFGVPQYCLDPLSDEMCCNIIKQAAVRSQDHRSADKEDLDKIAPEIAKLCKGIPLAAQLFGSVLQFKEYKEWPQLLDFQAFSTSSPVDISLELSSTFSPVDISLELSYRSMPPNLRLCFTYCAFVFVTEHKIVKEYLNDCLRKKEDLIHQWIALDLIEPSETFSTTQLAEQYLRRLVDMSVLRTTPWTSAKDDTCPTLFTMHREVELRAQASIVEDCAYLDEAGEIFSNTERCCYALVSDFKHKHLKSIFPDQKIRALRCFGCSKMELRNDSFSFARCLRVLDLHKSSMQKLPESICELRHLRYLKLSGWSGLVTLPESIGDLTNLLHIDLSACSRLENLQESFEKLTKLVHINLSGCLALVNLPGSFGKLTKLVHINLSGCLALVNLPGSFGKLTKLEHINLSGCPGLVNLPGTFGKLTNLEHINLSCCPGLENLPDSFRKLTNLAHIDLSGCSGLKELPQSFGKLIGLVHVNLSGCSGLVTLPDSIGDLKNLLHVDLSRCQGLSKLPESFGKLKKLVHLDLSFCSCFEEIQAALDGLTNIQHLNLSHPCCYRADYPQLQRLIEVMGQFIRLKHLNLSMFMNPILCDQSEVENRKYVELISGFSRLEYLDLSHNIFLCDLPESLANLHRLRILDLSGCIRIKKVERWMAQMQSLELVVLSNLESYHFVVSDDNAINKYSQLVDIRYKELEITHLQMIKSAEEARTIRLKERNKLQKLKLCWKTGCERYVGDDDLLALLVPPHSIQFLELHGYSSTCLPAWLTLGISSFNLVEVTMEDIPWCSQVPPLGLLPNLQRVVLRSMASITRIDAGELSGGNTEAFNRLSEFTMSNMDSLEEFTTTYYSGGEELVFSARDELAVWSCPNLTFVPLPPRAKRLVISDCNVVMVCWQNRAGTHGVEGPSCISSPVTEVKELVVENCRVYLSQWCLLNHLPGLESLTIKNCNNLISSPEIIGVVSSLGVLSSLKTLCFSHCYRMSELPKDMGGLSSLRELQIKSCGHFWRLPDSMEHLTSLQSMHFTDCNHMKELPPWLGNLTSLRELQIKSCSRFQSLPDSMIHLTSLQSMHFSDCNSMRKLPAWLGNLTSLEILTIERCTSISSLPWNLRESSNLKDLHIIGCAPELKQWCRRVDLGQIKPKIEETPTTTSEQR